MMEGDVNKLDKASIIEMARGAVIERVDMEMAKVMANIQDLNTEPGKARQISIKVTLKPDNQRANIKISYQVESKLAPAAPIETSLYSGIDDSTGEVFAVENTPNIPGQMALSGKEQEPPKILKFG